MKILNPGDYRAMPWKNGGGITHEVASSPPQDGFGWRLSIAQVSVSGPFSRFEGLRRVLTVIEGRGLNLVSNDGSQTAMYKIPTFFCGGTEIDGQLIDGPVRDFNLIYDPSKFEASVNILSGKGTIDLSAAKTTAIYTVDGGFDMSGIRALACSTILGSCHDRIVEFSTSGWAIAVQLS